MKRYIPVIIAAVLLSGCAGISINDLAKASVEQVRTVKALAERGGDKLGMACYDSVLKIVEKVELNSIEIEGTLVIYQQGRNIRIAAQNLRADGMCRAMLLDSVSAWASFLPGVP